MSKLRVDLERLMAGIDSPHAPYDRFVQFKARALWRRRGAAVAVSLVLVVGSLIVLLQAFGSPGNQPAAPTPREAHNGVIVFAGSQDGAYDLYSMSADGTHITNLTKTRDAAEFEPDWSADGSRIAFVHCVDCTTTDIYIMDADGSGISRVTNDLAYDGGPAWSPDGELLAYHSEPNPVSPSPEEESPPRNEDIYVVSPEGSGRQRLTSDPARELNPTWSPDGTEIAFLALEGTESSSMSSSIYVMNSDGSQRRRLTDPSLWAFGSPAWSPDGSRIAFVVLDQEKQNTDIYIMNVEGGDISKLTDNGAVGSPAWAPDGSRIIYATDSGGVYQVDLEGSQSRVYAPPSGSTDDHPAWQPLWTSTAASEASGTATSP